MEALAKQLLDASTQPFAPETKTLFLQLAEAINSTEDTTCLIGPVMKLLPNHNVQIKKSIHGILPKLCKKHPQVSVLAANSVLQDCADLNPVVKCMGVTSLTAIPDLIDLAPGVVLSLLSDGHPRVRLSAVQACYSLNSHTPTVLTEHGIVDTLYACVRDSDPQVATCSLLTLDAVLAEEGGVIVTRAMARHLLRRLSNFPAPQLASVLQALAKYKPKEETELFEELSCLDPFLIYSSCAAVTVNCISLFFKLISGGYENLLTPLVERSTPTLTDYLIGTEKGALYVLDFLSSDIALAWRSTIPADKLVPLESDTITVKVRKIKLLPQACTPERATELLSAVTPWCHDPSCRIEAIHCVCQIRAKCPEVASQCLELLLQLLDAGYSEITLAAMENFSLKGLDKNDVARTVEKVVDKLDLLQPASLPALLPRLLGMYGELLPTSPYLLEHLVNCYHELLPTTRSHLLTASLRLFLKQPAECQLTLGRLLCECEASSDPQVASRASKYLSLLTQDPELVRDILR